MTPAEALVAATAAFVVHVVHVGPLLVGILAVGWAVRNWLVLAERHLAERHLAHLNHGMDVDVGAPTGAGAPAPARRGLPSAAERDALADWDRRFARRVRPRAPVAQDKPEGMRDLWAAAEAWGAWGAWGAWERWNRTLADAPRPPAPVVAFDPRDCDPAYSWAAERVHYADGHTRVRYLRGPRLTPPESAEAARAAAVRRDF